MHVTYLQLQKNLPITSYELRPIMTTKQTQGYYIKYINIYLVNWVKGSSCNLIQLIIELAGSTRI